MQEKLNDEWREDGEKENGMVLAWPTINPGRIHLPRGSRHVAREAIIVPQAVARVLGIERQARSPLPRTWKRRDVTWGDNQYFAACFGIALLSTVMTVNFVLPVEMDVAGWIVSALLFAVFFLASMVAVAFVVER